MLFCLFGDVDLLVAVLGRADDLDDGDGSSGDEVDSLDLIAHRLEDILDLPQEGQPIYFARQRIGHCYDVDIRLQQTERSLKRAEHLQLDIQGVGQFLPNPIQDLHEAFSVAIVLLFDLGDLILNVGL